MMCVPLFLFFSLSGEIEASNRGESIAIKKQFGESAFAGAAVGQNVCLSHDGSRVATASFYRIAVWDVDQKKMLSEFNLGKSNYSSALNESGNILRIFFCDNADCLIILTSQGYFRVDYLQKKILDQFRTKSVFSAHVASFSRDGRWVVFVHPDSILVYDRERKKSTEIKTVPGDEKQFEGVSISETGKYVVTNTQEGCLDVWDVSKRMRIATKHTKADVKAHIFLNESPTILYYTYDFLAKPQGKLLRWEPVENKDTTFRDLPNDEWYSFAMSQDGALLAGGSFSGLVSVVDLSNKKKILGRTDHVNVVKEVAFSRDKKRIATTSRDGTANVWSLKDGRLLTPRMGHRGVIEEVVFSAGADLMLTKATDDRMVVWRSDGSIIGDLNVKGKKIIAHWITYSKSFLLVVDKSASQLETSFHFFDRRDFSYMFSRTYRELILYSVALSPDGETLAFGVASKWKESDPVEFTLYFEATITGKEKYPSKKAAIRPYFLQFSNDSKTLVIRSDQENAIMNVTSRTWHLYRHGEYFSQSKFLGFVSDNSLIIAKVAADTLSIRDVTGKLAETSIKASGQLFDSITAMSLSPTRNIVALGLENPGFARAVEIRRTENGKLVKKLNIGIKGEITVLNFSDDGNTLAIGGRDSIVVTVDIGCLLAKER